MRVVRGMSLLIVIGLATVAGSLAPARADVVAYLINVTVRPGYDFANADEAIRYGHTICDKVAVGRPFALIVGDVKSDFNTDDEHQATYLTSQAVNELCPAMIWQLRNSAAHYQPPAPR
jgi:Protein of unknown function (DUF732)